MIVWTKSGCQPECSYIVDGRSKKIFWENGGFYNHGDSTGRRGDGREEKTILLIGHLRNAKTDDDSKYHLKLEHKKTPL